MGDCIAGVFHEVKFSFFSFSQGPKRKFNPIKISCYCMHLVPSRLLLNTTDIIIMIFIIINMFLLNKNWCAPVHVLVGAYSLGGTR